MKEFELLQQKTALACQHLDELVSKVQSTPGERSLLQEAVEELSTTLEELHIASEMIRQEQVATAAAYELAEVERRRYQDLFSFAPDGYLVTEENGVIEEANEAVGRLLRIQRQYLVGKPLAVFLDHASRRIFGSW